MRNTGDAGAHRTCRRSVGIIAASLVALSACGLGEKAALEDRITAAPARTEGVMVAGTLSVESRLYEVPERGVSAAGGFSFPGQQAASIPEGGVTLSTSAVRFEMDLERNAASLFRPGEDEPYVLIDDLAYYGKRAGVPEDDARPWVRLALDDLAETTAELDPFGDDAAGAVSALHPALVTDLVAGTLTGSIERAGHEQVAGASTTRYRVNVALDKALGDTRDHRYPEDRLEAIEELVDALGVTGNVHAGSVWLDDEGRLRRFTVDLSQEPLPKVEFGFVITMEFQSYGGSYDAEVPEPREVLTVDSVLRFVATVTEREPEEPDVPAGLEEALTDGASGAGGAPPTSTGGGGG